MAALFWFILWAVLIFLMLRIGCGTRVMGDCHDPGARHGGALGLTPPETARDPVCGKTVRTATAKSSVLGNSVYYFCSSRCRELFEATPHVYAPRDFFNPPKKLEKPHG